jgi:hypothetical protein
MFSGELPPSFPSGTELTSDVIDAILRELWRWRRADAVAPLTLDFADSSLPPSFAFINDPDVLWCDSGSGFAAASRSSPSSATVTILSPNGTDAGLSSTSATFPAYSPWSKAIGASKLVLIKLIGGWWYVVAADC